MFDTGTPYDTKDVKPEIKFLPNFVKSVLINCCDVIGNPLLVLKYGYS